MIHGKFPRWKISAAVMALPLGKLALPPLAFPQFPGFAALAFEISLFRRV
jgi:hypothetical protein